MLQKNQKKGFAFEKAFSQQVCELLHLTWTTENMGKF